MTTDKIYQLLKTGKVYYGDKNPYIHFLDYDKTTKMATLIHDYKEEFVNTATEKL
jgi:hypothetical protein